MAEIDPNLVRRITEQVVASMRQGAPRDPRAQAQASLHPPIGVCTGDYSKFTDRPDLRETQSASSSAKPPSPPPPAKPGLDGIITARQLQDAIDAAADGIVVLGPSARLTPLANDLAKEKAQAIERSETNNARPFSAAPPERNRTSDAGLSWRWWADDHCPDVVETVNSFGRKLVPGSAPRTEAGLTQAVGDLVNHVQTGNVGGGVLFVRSAARAGLLANRCRALRAAVASCPEAVAQAVEQIGVNVLIMEYPYHEPEAMRSMIEKVVIRTPKEPALLGRQMRELVG